MGLKRSSRSVTRVGRRCLIDSFCESEAGSEMIEFALTATVFFALLLGFCEVARAVYLDHLLAATAQQAARYAMVRGATAGPVPCSNTFATECIATPQSVAAFVASRSPLGTEASSLDVATIWPSVSASGVPCPAQRPGCLVQVTLTYHFHFLFSVFPQAELSLTSRAGVTISR